MKQAPAAPIADAWWTRAAWAPLALVLLAGLWRQGGALRLPFFADDYFFLDSVRHRSLLAALVSPDALGNFVRPVSRQLYWWAVSVTGASPLVAHAINLALFLAILALLFAVVRRLASTRAAAIAAGLLAVHYAIDIPVRWASGSQDLLAAAGGLAALWLFLRGWRFASAGALLLALLSKETVVLAPAVAALAARRAGEPWRRTISRAWPLAAAVAIWAAFWRVSMRPSAVGQLSAGPLSVLAALAHLGQVLIGVEWRAGESLVPRISIVFLAPLALTACAALIAFQTPRRPKPVADHASASRHAQSSPAPAPAVIPSPRAVLAVGIVWMIAGALPVTAVAPIWSNYYYLFALCGAGLVAGALLARTRAAIAVAVLVALALGSEVGRKLDEFATAPGAWTIESHLTRYYIDRGMAHAGRYLASLRRQRPDLPPRSVIFFAEIPAQLGWQAADGPLVRWAYRDSSLRSYYLSGFTYARASRRPLFVFQASGDTLRDITSHPLLMIELAMNFLAGERYDTARDALRLALDRNAHDEMAAYCMGWVQWATGDSTGAMRRLESVGCVADTGPSPELRDAGRRLAAGDSAGAEKILQQAVATHALDPRAHVALCELEALRYHMGGPYVLIEAFAAHLLAPGDALSWRRWGFVQEYWGRDPEALRSLERYFALGGARAAGDRVAHDLAESIRRGLPGGDIAQSFVRRWGQSDEARRR